MADSETSRPDGRRHHYVPRLLLNRFATERKKGKYQTVVFDKSTGAVFKTAVENAMLEFDFNALEKERNRLTLEPAMGKIEDQAALILEKIITQQTIAGLTKVQHAALCTFAALQNMRGPSLRNSFADLSEGLIERFANEECTPEFREEYLQVPDEEELKILAFRMMPDALPEFAAHFAAKDLFLARTTADHPFILGDTPVAMTNEPFPEHLPRERIIVEAPTRCECCGGDRLRKLGEDITESLDVIPRQFRVLQYVREKFACRECETVSQAPAPFHAIPRAWASPSLLAMMLVEKFAHHKPLNRQLEQYENEGVTIALSTAADAIGACCFTLQPLLERLEQYVFSAARLHGDDTTIPVLAKGQTDTGRIWTYVRDDAPFGGTSPPAAMFYYSRDRTAKHPEGHLRNWSGLFQADAYGGYNALYKNGRTPGPILEAACWAHARRPFFKMADMEAVARRRSQSNASTPISPIGLEMAKRIDALFDIERGTVGRSPEGRKAVRQELSKPLIEDMHAYMLGQRARLSRGNDIAKALDYLLKRWDAFKRFLDDGRICLSNNAAERAVRGIALGRKSWLFAGSDQGGQRAAAMYSLIYTAKLNHVDPQAWLADVLARINGHPNSRLGELLPWNWKRINLPEPKAA